MAHCPPPALPLSAQEDLHGPAVAAVLCTWLWVAPSDLDYSALQPDTGASTQNTWSPIVLAARVLKSFTEVFSKLYLNLFAPGTKTRKTWSVLMPPKSI